MKTSYDKYYQTSHLFGEPYPELMVFFAKYPQRGKVLDLGCGQGRDAIALARMGYEVLGLDHSKVGIEQMNGVAQSENLNLIGRVADIFAFEKYEAFDFVLLDSMFHFSKKDKAKETALIQSICSKVKSGCLVIFCIQETGNKVQILNEAIDYHRPLKRIKDQPFKYVFNDQDSGHQSETNYRLIIIEK